MDTTNLINMSKRFYMVVALSASILTILQSVMLYIIMRDYDSLSTEYRAELNKDTDQLNAIYESMSYADKMKYDYASFGWRMKSYGLSLDDVKEHLDRIGEFSDE